MKTENRVESFYFTGAGGARLFAQKFRPKEPLKGILQIAHGMRESTGYYREFCDFLTENGFLVALHDARGHGRTAGPAGSAEFARNAGILEEGGFPRLAEDLLAFRDRLKGEYPDRPVFLLGHSMGSVIARLAAARFGSAWDGLLLSGTAGPYEETRVAPLLEAACAETAQNGPDAPAVKTPGLLFGHFNDRFAPVRTGYEYMSRDEEMVRKAISSPDAAIRYSCGFYVAFLQALREVGSEESIGQIPKELPVLLFSGDRDPFGDGGRGIRALRDAYRRRLRDVSCFLYKGGRHEMLRETNRMEVFADVLKWLETRLP